jgi:hypothetical protein
MNKTENPSAFPWANDADKQYNWIHRGMTLRDYFAAQAMQAEMSKWKDGHEDGYEGIAELCYCMADAMIRARDL